MVPKATINLSDVRDIAKNYVLALENKNANGKRFIVATEKAQKFKKMTQILKSNVCNKVSSSLAPNFLLNFIGKTYNDSVSSTMTTFKWKPISFEKTLLDTARFVARINKKPQHLVCEYITVSVGGPI